MESSKGDILCLFTSLPFLLIACSIPRYKHMIYSFPLNQYNFHAKHFSGQAILNTLQVTKIWQIASCIIREAMLWLLLSWQPSQTSQLNGNSIKALIILNLYFWFKREFQRIEAWIISYKMIVIEMNVIRTLQNSVRRNTGCYDYSWLQHETIH